jgi:quercetin dioxygenase-like cupin family protein
MAAYLTKRPEFFDERTVLDAFARERMANHRWSNAPGDVYDAHSHGYYKVLFCLQGSITLTLTESRREYELHEGDRLDIEPNTPHSAVVGPDGVTCIEAARP